MNGITTQISNVGLNNQLITKSESYKFPLDTLPTEILFKIFEHLGSLVTVGCVKKEFNAIVKTIYSDRFQNQRRQFLEKIPVSVQAKLPQTDDLEKKLSSFGLVETNGGLKRFNEKDADGIRLCWRAEQKYHVVQADSVFHELINYIFHDVSLFEVRQTLIGEPTVANVNRIFRFWFNNLFNPDNMIDYKIHLYTGFTFKFANDYVANPDEPTFKMFLDFLEGLMDQQLPNLEKDDPFELEDVD